MECFRCQKNIKPKDHLLKCKNCKNYFDLLCANVTKTRYIMMTNENKNSWKCSSCVRPKNASSTPQTTSSTITQQNTTLERNITHRKRLNCTDKANTPQDDASQQKISEMPLRSPSCVNLSQITNDDEDRVNSTLKDNTFHSPSSLPNMSTMDNSLTVVLKAQVEELNTELSCAHEEVARLNIENGEQQQQIEKLNKKISVLMLLNKDPIRNTTPTQSIGHSQIIQHIQTDENIKIYETKIKNLEREIIILNSRIKTLHIKLSKALTSNTVCKRKSDALANRQTTLSRIQLSTMTLQKTVRKLEQHLNNTTIEKSSIDTPEKSALCRETQSSQTTPVTSMTGHNTDNHKPRLLLLSDFHGADLLHPLSKIRKNDYDFMADIIQYGTTQRVVQNIEEKIKDFKKSDCVIIMCGGSDYNITPLGRIISTLENTIKKCSHTNVIVCNILHSLNKYAEEYNNFVSSFNVMVHKQFFGKFSHVWLETPNSAYFGMRDYDSKGYQLNYRGKQKLARNLNNVLINVNKAFYNQLNFLWTLDSKHQFITR
jgi:hypothetical protein